MQRSFEAVIKPIWGALTVLILVAAALDVSQAAVPAPYVGRWAVQSGRLNFLILEVVQASNSVPLSATLLRPEHFAWYPKGNGVGEISGTYLTIPADRLALAGTDLDMNFVNPVSPSDSDEIRLSLIDADHGEIRFVGSPLPPISVVRVKSGDGPYAKWAPDHAYGITDSHPTNTVMTAIFDEDQNDRRSTPTNSSSIAKADAVRRSETAKLLDLGQLHTGEDYYHAAFVFQHGVTARDYLLAHALAMVALTKRQARATWIASATLDRYLQKIGQPQIFGTQFLRPKDGPVTQNPFDRQLISDALRAELDVDPLDAQQAQATKMQTAQPVKK